MTDAQVLTAVPSGNIGITCPDLTVPLGEAAARRSQPRASS